MPPKKLHKKVATKDDITGPLDSESNPKAEATAAAVSPNTPSSNQESTVAVATKMTCAALVALKEESTQDQIPPDYLIENTREGKSCPGGKSRKDCPKQHQLPMFLSKTYHMIDRCDPDIATWSPNGDSFVVKSVEKFASQILPMYFKHSNFSSFARQLNFYGFRKLKAEPILTADFDARTASYVRFYHEKFQREKPELLTEIKRATKSDQQSKDDVDSLKGDIAKLKEAVNTLATDYDRRMTEMSYEYNRRITALSAEYDKLAVLLQQLLTQTPGAVEGNLVAAAASGNATTDMMRSLSQVAAMSLGAAHGLPPRLQHAAAAAAAASTKRAAEELAGPAATRQRLA